MTQQIQMRLDELKTEYEKGQARLQQLEGELKVLRDTMLRISGAIQVLEEIQRPETISAQIDSSAIGETPKRQDFIAKVS